MKSFIYPFDSLNPDLGDRGSSGLLAAINVNPVSGMYCPGPSVQEIRDFATSGPTSINNQIVAMYPHDELIFTACRTGQKLYGGDVYGITMNQEEYEVTPASGWDSTPAADEWNYAFASYGDILVAAVPDNKLVYMSASSFRSTPLTTNFEFESTFGSGKVASSFSPEAKHIVTHGGHLVAAGITVDSTWNSLAAGTYDNLVWWSGFDDPLSFGAYAFTPEVLGSDYKFLYDTPGGVTGMISAGDYLFVFKENYIYIVEGPPFRFHLLATGVGTSCPNSIMFHKDWVYFMTRSGPARINSNGEYNLLCEQKTKTTLNVTQGMFASGYGAALSLASHFLYPFAFKGFNIPSTEAFSKVYTAVSEQYNIVYFLYPASQKVYEGQGVETFRLSYTVLMSYDIVTGNIGYSVPWPVEQTFEGIGLGTTVMDPKIPWETTVLYGTSPYYTRGTRNCFAMTTLLYKPDKGKAKDVIIIGTRNWNWFGNFTESSYDMQYNYLDPTIFYGKNWSMYTRTNFITKIIRPSKSTSRIVKIRPIMRIGHGYDKIKFRCYVLSFSDISLSGQEIYNHEEICEMFSGSVYYPLTHDDFLSTYVFDNKVAISESNLLTKDGSIIFEDSRFADEHIIIFSFHTGKDDQILLVPVGKSKRNPQYEEYIALGDRSKANFCTTTGVIGLEVFYDEQGVLSR